MENYKNQSFEDLDKEVWKDIDEFQGYFKVSNFGRVKNQNKIMKQYIDKDGYCLVNLYFNKKQKLLRVHKLVANCFLEQIIGSIQINHINSIKQDNNVSNLEWVTVSENNCHRFINKKTTSSFRGVCYVARDKRWISQIQINKKKIHLGMFLKEEDAKKARMEYEKKMQIKNKYS
jgi:hypothetical protein